MVDDVNGAKNRRVEQLKRKEQQELEKEAIVASSDAVVDPGAVMVKFFDAAVAYVAVGGPRRSVNKTNVAPFKTHVDSFNVNRFIRKWFDDYFFFFFASSRINSRIRESG